MKHALVHAFARFVAEGVGTPAPVAPTRQLVVGGLYRYVRNPMYLAVLAAIAGQALVLGRLVLVPYAVVVAAAFVAFVRWYEEPTLAWQFGDRYQAYRAAVPGWWPRRPPGGRPGTTRGVSIRVSVMPDACDGWRLDHWRVLTSSRRSGLISLLVWGRTLRVSRVQNAGVAPSQL